MSYIILSILLMKLAEKKKLRNRWLSWLPIGNLWILGKIIESFSIGKKRFNNAEFRLTMSSIVFLLVFRIPVVGLIVGVAYVILVTNCAIEFARIISKEWRINHV